MQKETCIYAGCRRVIKVHIEIIRFDCPFIFCFFFKVFDSLTHQLSFEFELPTNESIYSLAHSDTLLFAGSYSGAIYVINKILIFCSNDFF